VLLSSGAGAGNLCPKQVSGNVLCEDSVREIVHPSVGSYGWGLLAMKDD